MIKSFVFLVVVFSVTLSSCARAVKYSGKVVDISGSPVVDAKVRLSTWHPCWAFYIVDESPQYYFTLTNANGYFEIDEHGNSLYRKADIKIISPNNSVYSSDSIKPIDTYVMKHKIGTPGNLKMEYDNYDSFCNERDRWWVICQPIPIAAQQHDAPKPATPAW